MQEMKEVYEEIRDDGGSDCEPTRNCGVQVQGSRETCSCLPHSPRARSHELSRNSTRNLYQTRNLSLHHLKLPLILLLNRLQFRLSFSYFILASDIVASIASQLFCNLSTSCIMQYECSLSGSLFTKTPLNLLRSLHTLFI